MYNITPKTHFVGKTIQVLPSCPSTNRVVSESLQQGQLDNGEVVITTHQTAGRGQRGNVWESEQGKNLTFSIGVFDLDLPISEQFRLHFITALAIVKTINENTLAKATIKWPNDVFIGDKKVGGILIENNIRKNEIFSSVIGIGLNINQVLFVTDHATSLAIETQQTHFLNDILQVLLENFEHFLLRKEDKKGLANMYLSYMYRLNILAPFEDDKGEFQGTIRGIDDFGRLLIEKNENTVEYNFKEVKYLL